MSHEDRRTVSGNKGEQKKGERWERGGGGIKEECVQNILGAHTGNTSFCNLVSHTRNTQQWKSIICI